ncbi:MAG: hypothetical protein DRI99_01120 [Candidatus Aminicenantes bacterium]|nr:MAG: hypothetical protein DRJ11_09685 [Candidatus Aminicenantes bacterium]RLE05882.1 MAG: hypothetical protein DRI99_01120 [Candidatus Aminicenantes bacterium]
MIKIGRGVTKMKKIISILFLVMFLSTGCEVKTKDTDLVNGFKQPGHEARPRAYWNWLNGAVTLDGLTRDLEEAKDKGLAGLEIWDTEAMQNPDGFVPTGPPFLGPESVAAIHHSMKEAHKLGLTLGLVTSSGWNAGGSWVPPEMASKNLYYSILVIKGPAKIRQQLEFPEVPPTCPKGEDGRPKWYLDVAVLAWPYAENKLIPDISKVINITDKVTNGQLVWDVPPGKWQIVRFICTNNGQQLIAASPNSKGLFIDFLDPKATRFHFEYILNKVGLKKGANPDCPLKYLEVDSMELEEGIQWTAKFPQWFNEYNGYDPIPWLPVLTGWTVKDKDTSDRFIYDYKKTISDLLIFSHYTTGSQVCAEYGLQLVGEAGGPGPPIWDSCPVDALKALGNVDIPRGEFWIKNRHNIFLVKEIASASHIYGKKYVDAESWTTWLRWQNSPLVLKQLVDRAFCEGLNRITYHVYAHSPEEAGFPGRAYHAGVDLNPRVVWWPKARPFMDYLARCCYMLQQGLFVADVAYYYGDKAPNFWPLFHNVPEKPLLEGLGEGYDYDVVNTDVILNRMTVKDGLIVLPDGMSYRLLVLPDERTMPLEVLIKLEKLVSEGATIIGPKPEDVPGLKDHQKQAMKLRDLADRMWGKCDGISVKQNYYGRGKVIWGLTPRQWLLQNSIGPDFSSEIEEQNTHLDYIHRRTEDKDIYFVRNKSLTPINTWCVFRVKDKTPQLWDPIDGSIKAVFTHRKVPDGTSVWLNLPPAGSVFVVFSNKTFSAGVDLAVLSEEKHDSSFPLIQVHGVNRTTARVRVWQNGEYEVTGINGQKKQIKVYSLPQPQTIEGEWTVEFDPKWGAPPSIILPKLISWTDHESEGVKYYSGPGYYIKTIDIAEEWMSSGRRVYLDLGEVHEVAEVFINGQSAGILWTPPFRTEITPFIKPGSNDIKVEVRNMWINRLCGDLKLPPEKRFCRTNIRSNWQLYPAGLLGPVRLLPAIDMVVDFSDK